MTAEAMNAHAANGCAADFQLSGHRRGLVGLWAVAALAVVSAHAGAVVWLMHTPAERPAEDAAAPAMMIDLSSPPEAVNTEENTVSDQMQDAQEVKTETPPPPVDTPPDPAPEPVAEDIPPPLDPLPPLVPDPIQPPVEQAEVTLPETPPPPKPEQPEKKPDPQKVVKPRKQPPPPPSAAANKAAAQVQQADRNVAQRTDNATGADAAAAADWRSRLMAHLERRKRYPSAARAASEQGVVRVTFRIDSAGNVLSASLAQSSGYPDLDQATLEMVQAASPVPAPPPGAGLTITAPIRYSLR